MSKKAELKRLHKKFKVGDLITWGNGSVSHLIVASRPNGVVVDVTSQKDAEYYGRKQSDGRYFLFVSFTKNNRNRSGRGPIRYA